MCELPNITFDYTLGTSILSKWETKMIFFLVLFTFSLYLFYFTTCFGHLGHLKRDGYGVGISIRQTNQPSSFSNLTVNQNGEIVCYVYF